VVTAAVHANLVESPHDAMKRMGQSKNRRLQEAFAAHLRHLGRVDPRDKHERVVLIVDNAPWQTGQVVSETDCISRIMNQFDAGQPLRRSYTGSPSL
jgi:hypothetical protein